MISKKRNRLRSVSFFVPNFEIKMVLFVDKKMDKEYNYKIYNFAVL